ncbi:MAG: hypothetical protein P4M07_03970 [Xanthobacteraceae bacterium]|nr:hypothetical protein [Xanthobacteraceae bacterium]
MTARAMAVAIVGAVQSPAKAQSANEAEIIGFHQLGDRDDQRAHVRFGILIGQNQQWRPGYRQARSRMTGRLALWST